MAPALLYRYPKFIAYAVLGSVCLFETLPLDWPDSLTDQVPFFWNVNTLLQRFARLDNHSIPLNVFEIFILEAGAIAFLRAILTRNFRVRAGRLFWPIAAYIGFVGIGWLNGMSTGGDFKISLQEVRSQFYFLIAYLMAVNVLRTPRDQKRALWLMVLAIGFKAILYTIRRLHYITFGGMILPDQGVGSHEEAFFFDCFVFILMALTAFDVDRALRRVMWALLPFVLMGDLACNRRAATAAFAIVIPMLLFALYHALPNRRRLVLGIALTLAVGMSIYYPAFKDRYGMLAQPARAIRSQFDPDPRDKSSNDYRVAEEKDLYATIQSSPIIGYGFGKPMLHAVPIADISKSYAWWDIMTHNQILWVWMRVGTLGFVAFWLMIAAIIVDACRTLRSGEQGHGVPCRQPWGGMAPWVMGRHRGNGVVHVNSLPSSPPFPGEERGRGRGVTPEVSPIASNGNEVSALALAGLLIFSALLIFGLLDLQLSNFRDMLFAGTWAGILATIPQAEDRR